MSHIKLFCDRLVIPRKARYAIWVGFEAFPFMLWGCAVVATLAYPEQFVSMLLILWVMAVSIVQAYSDYRLAPTAELQEKAYRFVLATSGVYLTALAVIYAI
jgi:hypothetical protein